MSVGGRTVSERGGWGGRWAAGPLARDDREDVLLADDEELLVVDLELGPGVLAVQDLLADLDVHRLALAVVEDPAGAGRDDHPLLGLLLRGVREDDPALRHLLARRGSDDDPIAQRLELRTAFGLAAGGQGAFLLCSGAPAAPRRHAVRIDVRACCRPARKASDGWSPGVRRVGAGSPTRHPVAISTLGVRVLASV